MAHPVHQGKREALFAAVQQRRWHTNPFPELLENILTDTPLEFVLHWQTRHPFHNLVVENRTPDFKGGRHTHAVDFGQDITRKVSLCIQVHQTAKRIVRWCIIVIPSAPRARVHVRTDTGQEASWEKGALVMPRRD